MIPKIIHYCWFGNNPKPKLAEKCIKSWKKYLPDYRIIEWNEENFDISSAPLYVRQAYEAKKWAFVTDYVRLFAVYNYGGIYFDTDVELLKSIEDLLKYDAFFASENTKYVATGLGFGAIKHNDLVKAIMDDYSDLGFIVDGKFDTLPCTHRNTKTILNKYPNLNLNAKCVFDNICFLSKEYFCPKDYDTGVIKKTKNTYALHHYGESWFSEQQRKQHRYQKFRRKVDPVILWPNRTLRKMLGDEKYEALKRRFKG